MVRRPSVVRRRPHFQTWISLRPVGQFWSNFMCSITGVGERLHKVLWQIGSKPWQQKAPIDIMGKTMSSPFLGCFLPNRFYTCRTCIKSRTMSNFGQIEPLTTELAALERLNHFHRLIMGKCCLHASSFIFDRIIIKVAGNQDRHKSLDVFWFRAGSDYSLWSYLPLNDENFTLSNLNISEASWPILITFYV